jgi:hypothetical protein
MTMLMALDAPANEPESTIPPASAEPQATAVTDAPAPGTYPRSVYKVDDIGIIIGGASEDAKAKVGRLPIRD